MEFLELAKIRQSCRKYDKLKHIEQDKIDKILEVAKLSPSACNGQPYFITICKGDIKDLVAKETQGMGMNKFSSDADVLLVISEMPYVKSAAVGSKVKNNDYRSIDIGILAAFITAEAASLGVGSCILGWFNNAKIREICGLSGDVRLVITLGYPKDEPLRDKKRKSNEELFKTL